MNTGEVVIGPRHTLNGALRDVWSSPDTPGIRIAIEPMVRVGQGGRPFGQLAVITSVSRGAAVASDTGNCLWLRANLTARACPFGVSNLSLG